MIKIPVKAQPVYRTGSAHDSKNLDKIKSRVNKIISYLASYYMNLKLFTELTLTTKGGKLFQSLINLFKK